MPRSRSPQFSETLQKHAFIKNVISIEHSKPETIQRRFSSDAKQKPTNSQKVLEHIEQNLKEIENFLDTGEKMLAQERHDNQPKTPPNKDVKRMLRKRKSKSLLPITYKLNLSKHSPRFRRPKLFFRNGKVGCDEMARHKSNVENTHDLVRDILNSANKKPLALARQRQWALRQTDDGHDRHRPDQNA